VKSAYSFGRQGVISAIAAAGFEAQVMAEAAYVLAPEMTSTCHIYVDGSDLGEIAPELRERIEAFVQPYQGRVRIVDQPGTQPADAVDLPTWDLGVNFEFQALTQAEKKELLVFFQSLSAEFDRDFVLGGGLAAGQSEEVVTIAVGLSLKPALEFLQPEKKA
jgi:hypothetical protein